MQSRQIAFAVQHRENLRNERNYHYHLPDVMEKIDPRSVYKYLRDKGVSHIHALGMLANIQGESGFYPVAHELHPTYGEGGYGLFQHTGARRRALFDAYDGNEPTWQEQIDFALTETETQRYLSHHFGSAEEAVEWFVRRWERPANPEADVKKREGFLAQIESMIDGVTNA
jgi:Phage tail lysozyme